MLSLLFTQEPLKCNEILHTRMRKLYETDSFSFAENKIDDLINL